MTENYILIGGAALLILGLLLVSRARKRRREKDVPPPPPLPRRFDYSIEPPPSFAPPPISRPHPQPRPLPRAGTVTPASGTDAEVVGVGIHKLLERVRTEDCHIRHFFAFNLVDKVNGDELIIHSSRFCHVQRLVDGVVHHVVVHVFSPFRIILRFPATGSAAARFGR